MNRWLVGCFTALLFAGTANATIIWTITGEVGNLVDGTDNEGLVGAEISLSVLVEDGMYGGLFGGAITVAPVSGGEVTITGSSVVANDGTRAMEAFPGGVAPLVYLPNFAATIAADGFLFPIGITLPSGDFLTIAHSFAPSTVNDAMPGDVISIGHFPTGTPPSPSFTAAVQNGGVSAQYASTFAVYEAAEVIVPVPEPTVLSLVVIGLAGFGFARRRLVSRVAIKGPRGAYSVHDTRARLTC